MVRTLLELFQMNDFHWRCSGAARVLLLLLHPPRRDLLSSCEEVGPAEEVRKEWSELVQNGEVCIYPNMNYITSPCFYSSMKFSSVIFAFTFVWFPIWKSIVLQIWKNTFLKHAGKFHFISISQVSSELTDSGVTVLPVLCFSTFLGYFPPCGKQHCSAQAYWLPVEPISVMGEWGVFDWLGWTTWPFLLWLGRDGVRPI